MGNSSGASRTHHRVIMQTCFNLPSIHSTSYLSAFPFLPSFLLLPLPLHITCCSVVFLLLSSFLVGSYSHISLYPVSSNSSSDNNNGNSEQHKICLSTIQSSLAVSARQSQYRRHLFLSHQDMTFDQQTRRSPAAVAWGQQVWKL